jgi:two-component system sensor histidine kinase KdpD
MQDAAIPHSRPPAVRSWLVLAGLLVAATGLGFAMDSHVSLTSQAMVYVLSVVVAAYTLRWKESIAAALGAVTAFNFFFVPPRWTFEVESREHLISLFTMLLLALVISHLVAGTRREAETARLHARRSRQLQELASALAAAGTAIEIQTLGQSALDSAFAGPSTLALCDTSETFDLTGAVESSQGDGLRCCLREAAALGPGTGRWPGLNAWYLPLIASGHRCGAACVQTADAADHAGLGHAQALCTLLAQALWRQRLSASMQDAQHEAQRQQVQSTFLAAISHDFRTPLAAVVGAASALQTQRDKLSISEQERLLASIVNEASHLSSVTENTLQLVRLSNATQDITMDWESVEEIVGAVLARLRQRDPTRRIKSRVPENLPLIKADPVLIAQLLGNLLDNALKYSADAIDLVVSNPDNTVRVSVKDRGPGIPEDKQLAIFEPYSRNDHAGQRGAGLGLAVCRAIAHAHGGTLAVLRRSGGGSSFTLSLPVDVHQPTPETA